MQRQSVSYVFRDSLIKIVESNYSNIVYNSLPDWFTWENPDDIPEVGTDDWTRLVMSVACSQSDANPIPSDILKLALVSWRVINNATSIFLACRENPPDLFESARLVLAVCRCIETLMSKSAVHNDSSSLNSFHSDNDIDVDDAFQCVNNQLLQIIEWCFNLTHQNEIFDENDPITFSQVLHAPNLPASLKQIANLIDQLHVFFEGGSEGDRLAALIDTMSSIVTLIGENQSAKIVLNVIPDPRDLVLPPVH